MILILTISLVYDEPANQHDDEQLVELVGDFEHQVAEYV